MLIAVRILIFPYSAINEINNSTESTEQRITDDSFYASADCFKISRTNEYKDKKDIFKQTTIKIYFNQIELNKISVNGLYKIYDYSIISNLMTINDKFSEHEINGQSVYLLEDLAICYHENSTPKVVEFNEMNKQDESAVLTETIKKLVSEGNVSIFINAYDYLRKYDYKFANTISKRYMIAEFTNDEMMHIEKIGYKIEYLKAFFSN